MGNKKGVLIGLIVMVVTASTLIGIKALIGAGTGANLPLVSTALVYKDEIREEIAVKGLIQSAETASISSSLNAEVISVNVKVGDIVKKGQLLASLKQEDQTVQKYNDEIEMQELKNQYDSALVSLNAAKRALEASQKLYEAQALSDSDYQKAKDSYSEQKIIVDSISSRMDLARKKPAIGHEQYLIKSPIAGTVTRVNTNPGRSASFTEDNRPMFVIEDLSKLQMKVNISEYDIMSIKPGQEVLISAEILGDHKVSGLVSHIAPTGEQKAPGSTEMVIPVVIDIQKEYGSLMAGITAKALIITARQSDALLVPIDAISQDVSTNKTYVFIVKNGILKKVQVEIGLESNLSVEIISGGLVPGDEIVLAPGEDFFDGMKVKTHKSLDAEKG
ncbi:MAG: efflux RND transporter periplasmic adaptor subunit [Anaerovoracaceae bacterium]